MPISANIGGLGDSGSAGRFFYCAKNRQDLIEYIKKLITPENGIVKEIK